MLRDSELDIANVLLEFDTARGYTRVKLEHEQLQRAIETLSQQWLGVEENRISALLAMAGIDRELDKHGPIVTVARAVADDEMLAEISGDEPSEKAVRKLERLKIYTELPNPTYQTLDERRAASGVKL